MAQTVCSYDSIVHSSQWLTHRHLHGGIEEGERKKKDGKEEILENLPMGKG